MPRRALSAVVLLVLAASRVDARTIVFRTLNASLDQGSLAGTTFPLSLSYDADQIAPVGESFVTLESFDFTLLGVAFTRHDIFQGGQAIFENGILENVTASFQVILPPNSPVHNITFGFGGPGVIGYADLDNQFGSGSFTIQSLGWNATDMGNVGIAGSAVFADGTWTVRGAGADIWGTADAFQFLYRTVTGDGRHMMVRLDDLQNTNEFAKAGLMLRGSLGVDATTVILDVKPDGGVELMSRPSTGAEMVYLAGTFVSLPAWLQLSWQNGTVTALVSQDNVNWTTVGSVGFTLPSIYEAGVAVTSHDPTQLNTVHLDSLSVLPAVWTNTDIGSTGLPGNAAGQFDVSQTDQDSFAIQGAGADIWGVVDAFQFVHQGVTTFAANVQARVLSEQPTDSAAKVGVMIRDGLEGNAAFVILDMKPNGELEFMQRFSPGGEVTYLGGAVVGFNTWIRLVRHEPTDLARVTAEVSGDGLTWSTLGSTLVNMHQAVEVGVVVTSHDVTQLNTAVVDHVRGGNGAP
jgi:hypothetical protein